MSRCLTAMALSLAASLSVQAGLLPASAPSVTPESGKFRWTYPIILPTDSQLQTGNYFTIYDFDGYVAGSNSQPTGWTFSYQNTGPTPAGVVPDDNPLIPNLTWVYNGPTISTGQTGLGNFWAVSSYELPTDSFFTARTNRTSDGKIDTNITTTNVPVPTAPPPGVPEPTTLALAGLGLPLLGLRRLFRKRTG